MCPLLLLIHAAIAETAPPNPGLGSVDVSFDITGGGRWLGLAGDPAESEHNHCAVVNALAVQPDGKLVVAGDFVGIDGRPRMNCARLNDDGTVDTTFDSTWGADGPANSVGLQPDGKILLAGAFTRVNAVARSGVARLRPDGTVDPDFRPQLVWPRGGSSALQALVQGDGRVLIYGAFTNVNGFPRAGLARLNSNGSLDQSFGPGDLVSTGGFISQIVLQPDGPILVCGEFPSLGQRFIRLNADGSHDASFVPQNPDPDRVFVAFALAVQNDGKILAGHGWSGNLARWNPDGTLDASFRFTNWLGGIVRKILVQPDGKILISGEFGLVNGVSRPALARLNADGSLDTGFNPPPADFDVPSANASSMALAPDGKLIVATGTSVLRLNSDGSLDPAFQTEVGHGYYWGHLVGAVAVEVDGDVLISGSIASVNGVPVPPLVRLNGDLAPIAPVIVASVASQTRFNGQSVTFTVSAAGTGPLSYQWLFNDSPIPGATNSSLVISHSSLADAGAYSVRVSNAAGTATSDPATLAVLPAPTGPGSLDITFDPTQGGQHLGLGSVENEIYTLVPQPDGAVVVGGNFLGFNGRLRRNLARVGPNGMLEEGFNNSFGTDGPVLAAAAQPDGKLVIGGVFGLFGTEVRRSVARLNPNGTLDTTFFADVRFEDAHGAVRAVAVQPDGRILIGGAFHSVNDVERTNLARLNLDGSLDHNFNPPPAFATQYGSVDLLRVLADEKILIGGSMGVNRRLLHRLNPDGSADPSFAHELVGYWLRHLAMRSDGKMYAAGEIDVTGTGNSQFALVLVNADGTLDRSFHVDLGGAGLLTMEVQPDDRLIISGWFQSVNGVERARIARLNPNGTLDTSFDPERALSEDWREARFTAIAAGADDSIWLGGHFRLSGSTSSDLIRLRPDGRIDEEYQAQAGAISILGSAVHVSAMALQPDGRLFVGGRFDSFNNTPRANLARVHPDGRLDHGFQPMWGDGLSVSALALQPDGQLVVGGSGSFVAWDGWSDRSYAGLARLKPDGQVDTSFHNYWSEWSMRILCLALQSDGKILVGGEFEGGLARFNADGSFDTSFHPPDLPAYDGDAIHSILVQPDGKILIGGSAAIGLFRLEPDGSPDNRFVSGVQVGGTVTAMLLQPDGRILVALTAGSISGTDHEPCGKLVRLWPDGRLDTGFNAAFEEAPSALSLEPDGSILAAESIPSPGRYTRLHRLHSNGSANAGFEARVTRYVGSGMIAALLVQPDGQILIGGSFSSVNGVPVDGLARLNRGQSVTEPFVERDLTSILYLPSGSTYAVMLYAQPAPGVSAYAVEDQPPAGWGVSAISDGGVFDAATGKVKFGPFFDDDGRTLVYEVTPTDGATNAQCFEGIASADGVDSPIMGDACMLPAVPHPADCVLPGWRLAVGEVTAYGAAWRRGETWPVPPNPIPIDYVTRAAFLWRGGECYEIEPSIANAPLWWVSCDGDRSADFQSAVSQVSNLPVARRQMVETFVPGESLTLKIVVQPSANARAYAVEEAVPAGWIVTNVSHDGAVEPASGQVKWGPFLDATPRTLTYEIIAPVTAGQSVSFGGVSSVDGASFSIAGPALVREGCRLELGAQTVSGALRFLLSGRLGARFVIETSSDLRIWEPWAEVTNTNGRLELPASVTPATAQCFFRARMIE